MTDTKASTAAVANDAFTRSSGSEAARTKKRGEERRKLIRSQNARSRMK